MVTMGFPRDLIKCIQIKLANSKLVVSDKEIETFQGTPQGSVLSPTLYSLFVNDLLSDLEASKAIALAFADDLIVIAQNRREAEKATETVLNWTLRNNLKINFEKCGFMQIRKTKHKEKGAAEPLWGIKEVRSYKYLGTCIDNTFSFKEEILSKR